MFHFPIFFYIKTERCHRLTSSTPILYLSI
uniref:Uncharacterized protein n=1 Tax=Caudovirales sp. ct7oE3 TaxID=2826768 RepID=A0A8S5LZB0_9CAUD|nr:MAG TPA: hypothetical protein [Caudovirales sp. ct7oE3]